MISRFFRAPRAPRAHIALGLGVSLALFSCDNPDDSHDEHHLEAYGVALVQDADTLLSSISGDAEEVRGALNLLVGQTRGPVLLHFLDEEGHWFRPDEDAGSAHRFALDLGASTFQVVADSVQWSLSATGLEPDSTTLVVRVLHEGHDDFVSPALPVIITP